MIDKLTSKQIQVTLGIVAMVFAGLVMITALQGKGKLIEKEQIEQTFYVATPGGIAYEVNTMHKCGEGNMRMAAIHATDNQTGDMRFDSAEKILVAVTMDWARIYEGNIYKDRCEITSVSFTNITGKVYKEEEK